MISFLWLGLIILGVIAVFVRLRQTSPKRHWTNQTNGEKLLLSIALAGMIQFLFLFVTILPGWLIAVSIFGKGEFTKTFVGNLIFGITAITTNIIIYFPLFYLLLKWLFASQEKLT